MQWWCIFLVFVFVHTHPNKFCLAGIFIPLLALQQTWDACVAAAFFLFFYRLIPLPLPLHRLFITFYTEFWKEDKKKQQQQQFDIYPNRNLCFPNFSLARHFFDRSASFDDDDFDRRQTASKEIEDMCALCIVCFVWHCLCYYLEGI